MPDTNRPTNRRLNRRAVAALAILVLALGAAALALQLARPARLGDAAVGQIERLVEDGRPDLALRHLNRYLERFPDDAAMLFLQARLMAEAGGSIERVAQTHLRLLTRFPDHEEADEVRARLADLYIQMSDAKRAGFRQFDQVAFEYGYRAAIGLAGQLTDRSAEGPAGRAREARARLLLGRAREGLVASGSPGELEGARRDYETALELYEAILRESPDDGEAARGASEAATRLAALARDRLGDPAAAEQVLDRLVAALPGSSDALLIRFEHYRAARDRARADEALREARRVAPDDPKVLIATVEHALGGDDPAAARAAFAAIPEDYRRRYPAQMRWIEGRIEYAERQDPDPAVTQWQEGLALVSGNDALLNWWLAYVMIASGRFDEARTYAARFNDLVGERDTPRSRLLVAFEKERRGDGPNLRSAIEDLSRLVDGETGVDDEVREMARLALARCRAAMGDFAEADRLYRRADSASPAPVLAHAAMLERSGRPREAIELLTGALGRHGDDPRILRTLMRLHLEEQAARAPDRRSWAAFDGVAERARRAAGSGRMSAELELLLADRDLLDGRADAAAERLDAALGRWPDDPRLRIARAELRRRAGDPDGAVRLIEEGLAADDGPELRLALARLLIALDRGREAQRRLVDGIETLAPHARGTLWQALGNLRMAQGDDEGARQAFTRWAELAPTAPEPILALIELALKGDRIPDAEAQIGRLGRILGDAQPFRMADLALRLHRLERGEGGDDAQGLLSRIEGIRDGASAAERPAVLLMEGRARRALGDRDGAAAAYRSAWEAGARDALAPLTELLIELGRGRELEELAAARGPGGDDGAGLLGIRALMGAGRDGRGEELLRSAVDDTADAASWRARMLALAGRFDALEALLRVEAGRAGPRDAAPWIELVATQARLGRGRGVLEQTIRQALEHASALPPPLLEARLRRAAGDVRAADEVLEEALGREIVDPMLIIGAASYYRETGRPDLAEPLLERLMIMPEVGPVASLQLAVQLADRSAGDPETWRRALELARDGPMDLDRRLAIATVLARAPDPRRRDEAIPLFRELLADLPVMHPRAVEAREQLARLYLEKGELAGATEVTAVSASQPAPSTRSLLLHCQALLQADRLAEADRELARLELLAPGDPQVAALRVDQLLRASGGDPARLIDRVDGRLGLAGGEVFARAAVLRLVKVEGPGAAEAADRIARQLGDRSPLYRWVAGLVLAFRGRSAEALEHCASALETADLTDPIDRAGLIEAVLTGVQQAPAADRPRTAERAAPIVGAMLERRPGDIDLMIASAILRHQAGDYRAEADLYRQVLRRDPGHPVALYNLALVLSEGLDRADEALEQIERLANRLGPLPDVLGARGVILTRLGRYEEAIRDLERAVAVAPTADRHYYLARAYHKAGRDDQFRSHLDQARRAGLGPESVDRWQHDELRQLLAL